MSQDIQAQLKNVLSGNEAEIKPNSVFFKAFWRHHVVENTTPDQFEKALLEFVEENYPDRHGDIYEELLTRFLDIDMTFDAFKDACQVYGLQVTLRAGEGIATFTN